MLQWITDNLDTILWSLGGLVGGMVVSTVVVAIVIAKLPADYFQHDKRPKAAKGGARARRIAAQVLGWAIVLTGLFMLVLPGPGLAVVLIGIFLVDFPGKYKFQKKLVGRPGVFKGLNKIRKKFGKKPFVQPDSADDEAGASASASGPASAPVAAQASRGHAATRG
jgi:hypothetical protein